MHSERAKDLLYTHQPMGLRNTAVYVLRSSPFEYGDLASLDGCVVGMQSGQERIDRIADHLAKHGARCEFREFDDADSLERALFEGRVGAVASEDSPRLSAEKSVVTLPPAPLYFVTPTSRGDLLAEADDAMAYILAGEPDLVRTLSEVSVSKKDLKIVRDIEPMPRLKIDPQRIRQILFNLVGNAVKFTDQGFITITAQWRSGTFRFSVRDTGCGIAEEDLKHIADPYVQVGRGRQHGGTGLGLAICKQLVARMNGEIEVASGVGLGSQFDIIIPNVEADEEAPKQMTTTQRIRLTVSHHVVGVKRVLIADDSPVNLRVLKAMLMRFNVRCGSAVAQRIKGTLGITG